jgi:LPXTG-motif cell wall-anchored protein
MHKRSAEIVILGITWLLVFGLQSVLAAEEDFQLVYAVAPTPERCCGMDSLYVCLGLVEPGRVKLKALEEELSPGPKGLSVEELSVACRARGISVMAVRTDLEKLKRLQNPMILHVGQSHFIAFLGFKEGKLLIFDNSTGLFECTPELFNRVYSWQGVALIIGTPSPYAVLLRYQTPGLFLAGIVLAGGIFFFQRKRRRPLAT